MQWPKWVVLIAGSTGSALRAVRPPNLHITPGTRRDLVRPLSDAGSLYRSPLAIIAHAIRGELVGERDSGDFRRPSCQQRCDPGPILGAVDLGIANDSERAGHEQAAQIAIPRLLILPSLSRPPLECCFGNQPDPGREVATRSEGFRIGDARDKGSRQQRTDAGDIN